VAGKKEDTLKAREVVLEAEYQMPHNWKQDKKPSKAMSQDKT
jgi:hypothetical protein